MKQFICVLTFVALVGCSEEPTSRVVRHKKVAQNAPLVCLRLPVSLESTTLSQIESDLMHEIAEKMNRPLVVEVVSLRDIFVRLENGTADFSISVLNPTTARAAICHFSRPYALGGSCFLYRVNEDKACMSSASRLRIGVLSGTTSDFYLCKHRGNPVRYPTFEAMFKSFEQREIDAIFAVDGMVKYAERQSRGAYKTTPYEVREEYSIAVAKNRPDVLAVANEIISKEYAR